MGYRANCVYGWSQCASNVCTIYEREQCRHIYLPSMPRRKDARCKMLRVSCSES